MPIVYSAIVSGTTIVVSHQIGQGNFEVMVDSVIKELNSSKNIRMTKEFGDYLIHSVVENGILYACVGDLKFGRRMSYAFLDEIRSRFSQSTLVTRAETARYQELNRDFGPVLEREMKEFSSGKGDNLITLSSQVDEVKQVMTQNVEKVVARGENLEILLNKTQDLEESATLFRNTSRKVHRTMKWKNIRMWIILIVVVLIIVTLIILFATGVIKT